MPNFDLVSPLEFWMPTDLNIWPIFALIIFIWMENVGNEVCHFHRGLFSILNSVAKKSKQGWMNIFILVRRYFGTTPVTSNCYNCGKNITTSLIKKTGAMQWLACIFVMIGCPLGCCFIPFCIDGWKDITHSCPNCKIFLGKSTDFRL